MTKSELLAKLKELHELQEKCKEVKEKVNGLKDEIKAEMTEQEVKKMQVGDINVTCTKYITHRFNTEAFKKQFGYLYESYLKETHATRFTLTKKTKKKIKKFEVGKTYVYGFESTFEVDSRTEKEIWLNGEKYEILIDEKQKCEKVKIGIEAELKATEIASEEFLAMKREAIEEAERAEQEMMREAQLSEVMLLGILKSRELCMKQKAKQFQSYLRMRGEKNEKISK